MRSQLSPVVFRRPDLIVSCFQNYLITESPQREEGYRQRNKLFELCDSISESSPDTVPKARWLRTKRPEGWAVRFRPDLDFLAYRGLCWRARFGDRFDES